MVYQGTLIVYSVSLCTNLHYIVPYPSPLLLYVLLRKYETNQYKYQSMVVMVLPRILTDLLSQRFPLSPPHSEISSWVCEATRRGGYILAHSTSLSQGLHFLALRSATLMNRPFEFPQLKLCDWFAPVNFNES